MPPETPKTTYLLASQEPALLSAVEPVLTASGARVHIVLSAEVALAAVSAKDMPALALVDVRLPGLELGQFLAAARAPDTPAFPIVLFSDTVSEEMKDRIAQGVLDDLWPTVLAPAHLALRLDMVLRAFQQKQQRDRELDELTAAVARNDRIDRLTGVCNREAILSLLFRESDRVQRMKSSLCVILFDIDDFGHWNAQLGSGPCDHLLVEVAQRVSRMLRSYDLLGRVGKDEFLAALPGCSPVNAVLLAERIRAEVFGATFSVSGAAIRLSACFGVAPSKGRSPIVVLREAEEALRLARECGPESIQCASDCPPAHSGPVAFLSSAPGEESLAW